MSNEISDSAAPVPDTDTESDSEIIQDLIEKRRLLENDAKKKLEQEITQKLEDAKNNFNIFRIWAQNNLSAANLYSIFCENFDVKYRMDLYQNVNEYFMDDVVVDTEFLFYWKFLILSILKNHKRYRSYLSGLEIDVDNKTCNLALVRDRAVFRCFLNEEPLCYFKENGNDYYVS